MLWSTLLSSVNLIYDSSHLLLPKLKLIELVFSVSKFLFPMTIRCWFSKNFIIFFSFAGIGSTMSSLNTSNDRSHRLLMTNKFMAIFASVNSCCSRATNRSNKVLSNFLFLRNLVVFYRFVLKMKKNFGC